jgi:hypothetical protein
MGDDEALPRQGSQEVEFSIAEPVEPLGPLDELLPWYVGNLEAGLTAYLDIYADYEQANASLDRGLNLAIRGIARAALDEGAADVPPLLSFLMQSALIASMANIDLFLKQVQRLDLLLSASRALADPDPGGPLGAVVGMEEAGRWVAAKMRGPRGRNLDFFERLTALKAQIELDVPADLRARLLAARETRNAIAHGPVTKQFTAWPGVVVAHPVAEDQRRDAITLEALQDYLGAFDELADLAHQAIMRSDFGAGTVLPDVELP